MNVLMYFFMGLMRKLFFYRSLGALLDFVPEPNRSICFKVWDEYRREFQTVQGSARKHQAWPGGYLDHIRETMNIGAVLFWVLNALRPLPFSLGDVMLVLFLHDFEKLWKFRVGADGAVEIIPDLLDKQAQKEFRTRKFDEWGFVLTEDQRNALLYVEGEGLGYDPYKRVMGLLAALCHAADTLSARLWFSHPLAENDPWPGAGRHRDP